MTTTSNGSAPQRGRVLALLAAMIAARDTARDVGFMVRVNEDGIDTWVGVPPQTVSGKQIVDTKTAEHVASSWQLASSAFVERLTELLAAESALDRLADSIPQTYDDAMRVLRLEVEAYRAALRRRAELRTDYNALEDAMGRVRRECGRLIQADHLTKNDKPIADTPLDKLAGDHPTYVAHRELMTTVKAELEHAEARVTSLATTTELARVTLLGFMPGALIIHGGR